MSSDKKPGAPECGLYIRIADDFMFDDLVPKLRHLFLVTTRSDYEKNMHVLEIPTPRPEEGAVDQVREIANYGRQNGFAVILRGPAVMMASLQADGVLLEPGGDIAAARAIIGDDAILGLRCAQDRIAATKGAKAGVDYISFSAPGADRLIPPEILAWWSTAHDIPALIEGPITNDDCGAYVRAGATFIDSGSFILNHPKGVMQGAVDMLYAIDLALTSQTSH
jgi:thiamine monophosphate synthase